MGYVECLKLLRGARPEVERLPELLLRVRERSSVAYSDKIQIRGPSQFLQESACRGDGFWRVKQNRHALHGLGKRNSELQRLVLRHVACQNYRSYRGSSSARL